MAVAPKNYRCGALSDLQHKGQVAGPFMWLNLLVCLFVVSCLRYPMHFLDRFQNHLSSCIVPSDIMFDFEGIT